MRVDTVHAFQGKEDDIIIYSLVRADTSELRFVSDRRMLNVSFSRAKRLLIIVGHQDTALNSSQLSKAIEMLPKKNTVKPEEVL
jgi:superfamily I DNA and/or RNA helicase